MSDAGPSTPGDIWQELQEPMTKTCLHGTISGRKTDHYACQNRACGCHCHGEHGYVKSWRKGSGGPS